MQTGPALVLFAMSIAAAGVVACKRPAAPGDVPNPVPTPSSSSSVGESSAASPQAPRNRRPYERAGSGDERIDERILEETVYTVNAFDRAHATPHARAVRAAIKTTDDNWHRAPKLSDPVAVKF